MPTHTRRESPGQFVFAEQTAADHTGRLHHAYSRILMFNLHTFHSRFQSVSRKKIDTEIKKNCRYITKKHTKWKKEQIASHKFAFESVKIRT